MTSVLQVVLKFDGDHGQVEDEWVSMVLPKITCYFLEMHRIRFRFRIRIRQDNRVFHRVRVRQDLKQWIRYPACYLKIRVWCMSSLGFSVFHNPNHCMEWNPFGSGYCRQCGNKPMSLKNSLRQRNKKGPRVRVDYMFQPFCRIRYPVPDLAGS